MVDFTIGQLAHSTLGFERVFKDVERILNNKTSSTFPPHNILMVNENNYIVELAIAGFSKEEVEITVEDNSLVIRGEKIEKEVESVSYLHKGIGTRSFTKTLSVADTLEVKGAEFKDGILRVGLENVIPDHKKPRKVEISNSLNLLKPELLQESKAA
tara:strand:- start:5204 stop:5674 length:471 start_codon:yes stop_codon:yes gene_type:complete